MPLGRRHVRRSLRKCFPEPLHQSEFLARIQGVHRDVDAHGVNPLSELITNLCKYTSVHFSGQFGGQQTYPRQESLIRSFAPEINGFLKATSLNPTLFQGRQSPLAETR